MNFRAFTVLAFLAACGCVTRTMEIQSDPPGAAVWVNHRYVGRTPIEKLSFTHYGDYQITLRREGYRARSAVEKIYAPWHERFPIDLFSENLVPGRRRVERSFSYKLEPVRLRPVEEVLADAEAARDDLKKLPVPAAPADAPKPKAPAGASEEDVKPQTPAAPPPDLPEESPGPPRRRGEPDPGPGE